MNIKQAGELFGLTTETLRYYERVGVIPPVARNKSGYREFTISDLNWVYLVTTLRSAGLSIESLIEFCQLSQLRDEKDIGGAQKQVLRDERDELDDKIDHLKDVRALLDYKLEHYDDHVTKFNAGEPVEKLWENPPRHQD